MTETGLVFSDEFWRFCTFMCMLYGLMGLSMIWRRHGSDAQFRRDAQRRGFRSSRPIRL
jgi:hypothetical protein